MSDSRDPFLAKANYRRKVRGPKLWKYLICLLRDPTTNPSLITWENKAKGVFRLVRPKVIAQMWDRRIAKYANERLTCDNFARGLQHQHITGVLEKVCEKQLVYKLGPMALKALREKTMYGLPPVYSPAK